jgi:hypothetical protein
MCRKKELFEDTKGVFKSCKSRKDRKKLVKRQKNKQRSTKHYTEKAHQKPGVNSGAPKG